MGSDLVKEIATAFTEAVRACTSLSSESDCDSKCGTCHSKTTARDVGEEEILTDHKGT